MRGAGNVIALEFDELKCFGAWAAEQSLPSSDLGRLGLGRCDRVIGYCISGQAIEFSEVVIGSDGIHH